MKKIAWEDYDGNFNMYQKKYDLDYFVDMENAGGLNLSFCIDSSALCEIPEFGCELAAISEYDDQVAAWLPDGMFVYLDTSIDEVIESVAEEYLLFFRKDDEDMTNEELLAAMEDGYSFISNADPAYSSDFPDIDEEIREMVDNGEYEEINKNSEDFLLDAMRMDFVIAEQDDNFVWKITEGYLPSRIFKVGDYRFGL